jgi:hypothetical protein
VEARAVVSAAATLARIRSAPSPLLARQLARAGVGAGALRREDLSRLPALRPDDLDLAALGDPVRELALADAPRPVRLGACERGERTIALAFTAADLARAAEYGARALGAAGVRAKARVANTLEGGLATPGSLGLGDALERLGALDVPLGPVRDAKAAGAIADVLRRVRPDVLVLDPESERVLERSAGRERSWDGIIALGGEARADAPPRWRRRWISLPEVSVFFAVDCAEQSLHLDPDVEAEARDGWLRVSSLAGDRPLLAYEPGVRATAVRAGCRCGDPRRVLVLPDGV